MATASSKQFTEYEQMLIAAGWITPESIDSDYQAYVKRVGKYDADSYEGWRSMEMELVSLNDLWETAIAPIIGEFNKGGRNLTGEEKEIEDRIIRRTSELELFLGY